MEIVSLCICKGLEGYVQSERHMLPIGTRSEDHQSVVA